MKWSCSRLLATPLPSLPRESVAYPILLETTDLKIGSTTANQQNSLSDWLRNLVGDNTLSANYESHWEPEHLPPPWHKLVFQDNKKAVEEALKAHVLYDLRLVSTKLLNKPPYQSQAVLNQFDYPDGNKRLREALFFAFFDKPELFARKGIMEDWLKAIKDVIYERGRLDRKRKTESTLIRLGFDLLEQVQALRERDRTLDVMLQQWRDFDTAHSNALTITCAVVFWGEAAYCLSERGDMIGAQQLLAKQAQALKALVEQLPGLDPSDLMAGMWCHHLGRLAYYRGDMNDALALFSEEWQFDDRLNEANRPRLHRSCACVLTDIGFLEAAEQLTRQACQLQANADEPERYKSYGRLAEILIREDRYDEARAAYSRSLDLQVGNETDVDGQTYVYMGHTHILLDDFSTAETWYQQAEIRDNSRFNPYLCMGLVALYYRSGRYDALAELCRQHHKAIVELCGVKVLPKAVIHMARFKVGLIDGQVLREVFKELQTENYWVEACCFLPVLYPEPRVDEPVIQSIIERLNKWNIGADNFCQKVGLKNCNTTTGYFSLLGLLGDLEHATANGNWLHSTKYIKQIYPFKLLGDYL